MEKKGDVINMEKIGDLIQEADWKKEKHVPVIECTNTVKADDMFEVKITVGKEIPHPNTTDHHISWISLMFKPDGEKFPYNIGRYEFISHGSSAQGPNTSTIYTHPAITTSFKTSKPGILHVTSYCNIHGLWQSSKEIKIQ
jgi:superoxide reductase